MAFFREIKSIEDLMTDDKYLRIKSELEGFISFDPFVIKGRKEFHHLGEAVREKIRNSVVPEIRGKFSPRSAMQPHVDNIWTIGQMGSVFLDVAIDDKVYRIAYNPFEKNFVIQEEIIL